MEGGSGDRIFTATKGLIDKPELKSIMRKSTQYSYKTLLLDMKSSDDLGVFPIAYRYFNTEQGRILSSIRYVGLDWTMSRQGNRFAQFMTTEGIADYPITYCNDAFFPDVDRETVSSETAPDFLEEIQLNTTEKDDLIERITTFLSSDSRTDMFVDIVTGLINDPEQRIEIHDSKENLFLWVASITMFFPLKQALSITFNTYEGRDNPSEATNLTCFISDDGTVKASVEVGEPLPPELNHLIREKVCGSFVDYFRGTYSFNQFMMDNNIHRIDRSIVDYLPLYHAYSLSRGEPFVIDDDMRRFVSSHANDLDRGLLKLIGMGMEINDSTIPFLDMLIKIINDPESKEDYRRRREIFDLDKIRRSNNLATDEDACLYKKCLLSKKGPDGYIDDLNDKELFMILKLTQLDEKGNWAQIYTENRDRHQMTDPVTMVQDEYTGSKVRDRFWKYIYSDLLKNDRRASLEKFAAEKIKGGDEALFESLVGMNNGQRLEEYCSNHFMETIFLAIKKPSLKGTVAQLLMKEKDVDVDTLVKLYQIHEPKIEQTVQRMLNDHVDSADFKAKDQSKADLRDVIKECYLKTLLRTYGVDSVAPMDHNVDVPYELLASGLFIIINETLDDKYTEHFKVDSKWLFNVDWIGEDRRRELLRGLLSMYRVDKTLFKDNTLSCFNLYVTIGLMYGDSYNDLFMKESERSIQNEFTPNVKTIRKKTHDRFFNIREEPKLQSEKDVKSDGGTPATHADAEPSEAIQTSPEKKSDKSLKCKITSLFSSKKDEVNKDPDQKEDEKKEEKENADRSILIGRRIDPCADYEAEDKTGTTSTINSTDKDGTGSKRGKKGRKGRR